MRQSNSRKSAGRLLVGLALLAAVLAACTMGGVVGTTTVSKGVITAKGSVFVNGVEYSDGAAAITVGDAANHTDADLKVGMVVTVKGTVNGAQGQATEILYAADLQGTIDASPPIDTTTGVFYVFGHKVVTDATTVFEGAVNLAALAAGDRVEVSGTADAASGALQATRVEKQTAGGDFAIKGVVSALAASSFTLTTEDGNATTVDFTGTLATGIADGSAVLVKFVAYANPLTVTADKVRLLDEPKAANGDRAEVSGSVSAFVAGTPATFTVDGVSVSADASLVAGVANGVRVEVRGAMTNGVLMADSVKVHQESNLEAQGMVTLVDTTAGTLTVDGILFAVSSSTMFRDEALDGSAHFGLASILVGDWVRVEGSTDSSSGANNAAKVEKLSGAGETTLSGPVTAVGASTITIAGVTVDVSGLTNKATMLAVTVGTVVNVKGTVSGTSFTATQGGVDD